MTVSTTPRLGLMSPVDSDLFQSSDFAATFAKLDAVPGVQPVANYAALTTLSSSLTTAQHGNQYLELDNGAEWYWYQPSGSGVFKRKNNIGLITQTGISAPISTTTTTHNATQLITATITAPGVRAIECSVAIEAATNSAGVFGVSIYVNSSEVAAWQIAAPNSYGASTWMPYYIQNPTAGTSYTVTSYCYSLGVGGTTQVVAAAQIIKEV